MQPTNVTIFSVRHLLVIVGATALAACSSLGEGSASSSSGITADCPPGKEAGAGGGGSNGDNGMLDGGSSPSSPGSSTPTAPGFLHTQGGSILDSKGEVVRLTGLSWFGLETANFAPHGLWARSMDSMLDQIASLGFNVIRVPYSNQLFNSGSTPNGIDTTLNPDLVGKSGLDILDKLVAGAKTRGLRILLDRHRPDANGQSPLWFTDQVSEQKWIDDWKMLATRYLAEPTVIGADLHNEPHANATWGDGNQQTDWRLAAERAGNAIQSVNPNWLMIVEGVEKVGNDFYWWGGNLRGAGANPIRLTVQDRVVYSPHDYPPSVYEQSWFQDATFPANLPAVWDATWGYLAKQPTGAAPVLIGEFGTKLESEKDKQWLTSMISYITQNKLSFTFWSLNPDSGDTGGILMDDWKTVNDSKMSVIKPALAPLIPQ